VLYSAGQALKAVGRRLDAQEANRSAEAVVAAMNRTTEPYALDSLAQALAALGDRLDASQTNRAMGAVVVLLARATDEGSRSSLARALEAVGGSRSTPEVVAVLAQPLCAGAAQRALLDVLGQRCKRPFDSAVQFVEWADGNGVDLVGKRETP
jgi:hypothetical protein